MIHRFLFLALTASVLGGCQDSSSPGHQPTEQAPDISPERGAGKPVPGQYIVVFRSQVRDVKSVATVLAGKHRGKVKHTYQSALRGMALQLSEQEVAALRQNPEVAYVEQDQMAHAIDAGTQPNATLGLDRVDQRYLPLNSTYRYSADGGGVHVYIIDTGIRFGHSDFGGRAVRGVDVITNGGTAADCHGHGTHVAGTVGGSLYGIAKKVSLYAVRVLDCQGGGTYSQVIAGVDWVTANHVSPAVANLSLGGGLSTALNQAVTNSITAGVTYAVAAGNSAADACDFSPSSTPAAITVSASNKNDAFASAFSNSGSCVDLIAPGVNITSAWIGGSSATKTISGTSMASPHVAGAAALYLSDNAAATPSEVASALTTNATTAVLTGIPAGTVDRLLYTGSDLQVPVARFTYECTNFTCNFDGRISKGEISYRWRFGDGATGRGAKVTHTFAAGKTYAVVLIVTGTNDATSRTSKSITCNSLRCL